MKVIIPHTHYEVYYFTDALRSLLFHKRFTTTTTTNKNNKKIKLFDNFPDI